jgi:ubiquinone/menaquinone biosynthesis C-methylase UbiE
MKRISHFAQKPLLATGLTLSRIILYMAESLPLIYARRALGIAKPPNPAPPENHRKILNIEMLSLLKEDFENLNADLYKLDYLSAISPLSHAKRYLRLVIDSFESASRAKKNKFKEFSEKAKEHLDGLPDYYARNFHFQTDGYLSDDSADLYEHQTEILFMGTLSLMRRLLLAKLITIAKEKTIDFRILEIGAGTGETTELLLRALPNIKIEAIDLSEPYLAKARQKLKSYNNVNFSQADGLSYQSDEKFDAVVSSYCLHEMPLEVRKNIIKKAATHLKSGGHLLIIDSLQLGERPEFDWALKQFPKDFHEPFYTNYIKTPLKTLLSDDLELVEERSRFLSQSLLARKL